MNTSASDEPVLPPDPHTSHQLFQLGVGTLIGGLLLLIYRSPIGDPLLITLGAAVMVFGALPALTWARKGSPHFPIFEMFMLTCIPFYAVPLLGGHPGVLPFTEAATRSAAMAILLFQVCACGAFFSTRGRPVRSPALTESLLPSRMLRHAQAGIWLNTAYLYVNGFTSLVPPEFATVLRAAFFGIGTVSLFIEMRRWGAGQLRHAGKFPVGLNIALQILILFRDLYLIVGISVLLLALIGYVSTSRRIPLLVLGIGLPIVAVLHNGKSAMRTQYWEARKPLPTVGELPDFFRTWFNHGLQFRAAETEAGAVSLGGRLFERASLFQMLCLVTERTPESEPYLRGESYIHVPAQLVPSFLWPGKPSSLQSNILLAVHYGLVARDDPGSVSIAFGMVAESYANFGLLGCAGLGLLLGFGYKRLSLAAVGRPIFSALGLLTILLAAWSFQVEQIFATWLVSLIQAAFVVIGGPMAFRAVFGSS